MQLVSVSEAAGIKGVSKQAISKRLKALQEQGRIATTRRGRELVFSLAAYDDAVGETTNPARLVAQATRKAAADGDALAADQAERLTNGKTPKDPSYTAELTRKAGYEADLKEIEIRKQRGELLAIESVRNAMERCAEAIVRDIDQLPAFADDLAAAMARNGVAGLREALKGKARALRETLARSMNSLSDAAGEDDPAEMAAAA